MGKAGRTSPIGQTFILCIAFTSACQPPKDETQASATCSADEAYAASNLPAAQRAFMKGLIAEFVKAKRKYDAAPNEAVRYQLKEAWKARYCSLVYASRSFTNWRGRLSDLSQDSGGVTLKVDLGSGITVANGRVRQRGVISGVVPGRIGQAAWGVIRSWGISSIWGVASVVMPSSCM